MASPSTESWHGASGRHGSYSGADARSTLFWPLGMSRDGFMSEEEFQSDVFQKSPVGMALVDTKTGKFVDQNSSFCRLMEYTSVELETMTWPTLLHQSDRRHQGQAIERNRRFESFVQVAAKFTEVRWVRVIGIPDTDAGSEGLMYLYVLPVPASGGMKVEKTKGGDVKVRPCVHIGEFVRDNLRSVSIIVAVFALSQGKDLMATLELFLKLFGASK